MKWSVYQLQKMGVFPHHFEETLDFTSEASTVEDIISISPVKLTGVIERIDDFTYRFKYHMIAPLVLQCALTLEPVEYVIEDDYDEIYTTLETENYIQIDKQTFDTSFMAWSNIIIDKPISVTRPDAYEILKERGIDLNEGMDDEEEVLYYSSGLEDKSDIDED